MPMNYLQLPIAGVLGLVAPIIISTLKQVAWPVQVKLLVAFGVSALFGVVAVAVAGTIDTADYIGSVGVVFTVSNIFYQAYFANTELNTKLEKLGAPTPVKKPAEIIPADEVPTEK